MGKQFGPNSKDMEYLLGFEFGMSVVTDKALQLQDLDLMRSGKGFSVKMQDLAAKTDNFSFEVELGNSRTGAKTEGNFLSGKSHGYFLAWPSEYPGGWKYNVACFLTKELHEAVPRLAHRRAPLGAFAQSTNFDRDWDLAESLLVRVKDLLPLAKSLYSIDFEPHLKNPAFLEYRRTGVFKEAA